MIWKEVPIKIVRMEFLFYLPVTQWNNCLSMSSSRPEAPILQVILDMIHINWPIVFLTILICYLNLYLETSWS